MLADAQEADAAVDAAPQIDAPTVVIPVAQEAYIKASNPGMDDQFSGTALSADGNTLAVGAPYESSAATGINGAQNDDTMQGAGAVYIFVRSGTTWTQQAYVKASATNVGAHFGAMVGLSSDGNTLAVSAPGDDGPSDSAASEGAVYVFTRTGSTWTQQAYLQASNAEAGDQFGSSLALASGGDALVVGAYQEDSAATGVGGDQNDNSAVNAGAAYVFTRTGATWAQDAYLKASNSEAGDIFGTLVTMSGDGATIAVGAIGEQSAATGVDGIETDNTKQYAGAAYVFAKSGGAWTQQAYVKAVNTRLNSFFGGGLSLTTDGALLAVGALGDSSVIGDLNSTAAPNSGMVYLYVRHSGTWTPDSYLKASNPEVGAMFGTSVALAPDGSRLAVGALQEMSGATGINGNQLDTSQIKSGAVYLFGRVGVTWGQADYIKASNTGDHDNFSYVALSADGTTLAVGAPGEDSAASGIDGDQSDDSLQHAGAVYVFRVQP